MVLKRDSLLCSPFFIINMILFYMSLLYIIGLIFLFFSDFVCISHLPMGLKLIVGLTVSSLPMLNG